MKSIAIIGAGLSGLTVFHKLKNVANITIFEKSTKVGGRISVRVNNNFEFDHGAQFFTVKDKNFRSFLKPFIEREVVKQWNARFAEINGSRIEFQSKWGSEFPHYVGTPAMNSFLDSLSHNAQLIFETKVEGIKPHDDLWELYDNDHKSLGCYDWVISSAPAPQTKEILSRVFFFRDMLNEIKMSSCFSLMLGFSQPVEFGFDAAIVKNSDISWISVNSSKPDRTDNPSVLVHSSNEWADQNIDSKHGKACDHLLNTLGNMVELPSENLAFKAIRSKGYFQALFDLRNKLRAQQLSIEEEMFRRTFEESIGVYNSKVNIAEDMSKEDLADQWNVSTKEISKAIDFGVKVEMKNNPQVTATTPQLRREQATKITIDNLVQDVEYYPKMVAFIRAVNQLNKTTSTNDGKGSDVNDVSKMNEEDQYDLLEIKRRLATGRHLTVAVSYTHLRAHET